MKYNEVEIKVTVPSPLVDFVKKYVAFANLDLDEFWRAEIINMIKSLVEAIDGPYLDPEDLIKDNHLDLVFKK